MLNRVTNIVSIQPSTKDGWRKVLKHISPKNKRNLTDGDECFFDFDRIITTPKTLNITSGSMEHKMMYQALLAMRCGIIKSKYSNEKLTDTSFEHTKRNNAINAITRVSDRISKYGFDEIVKSDAKEWRALHKNVADFSEYEAECIKTSPTITRAYLRVGLAYIENLIEYGTTTAYEWRCKNWGTKCNAWDCHINKPSGDFDNETRLSFQTAWVTPDSILKALSKQLPDITFTVKYACENLSEGCGETTYHNGESTVKRSIDNMDIEAAYRFACEVWGEDPEELPNEQ